MSSFAIHRPKNINGQLRFLRILYVYPDNVLASLDWANAWG